MFLLLAVINCQAALCEHAFEALYDYLSVQMECFASPLNARYDRFCSAFPDVDQSFGSQGSFFEWTPDKKVGGSFEVNPPFIEPLKAAMTTRLHIFLEMNCPLTFVVIVPGWREVVLT